MPHGHFQKYSREDTPYFLGRKTGLRILQRAEHPSKKQKPAAGFYFFEDANAGKPTYPRS